MHEQDNETPRPGGKERKGVPRTLGECIPGDIVKTEDGVVVQVTARIWDTPMGRIQAQTEFGWGELHCMDARKRVAAMVKWAT